MDSFDRTSAPTSHQTGCRARESPGERGAGEIGGRATRDFLPEQILPEQLLASLWQKRAARQQQFKTNGGRRVRVLYPGRPSSSAGPDFRDAVFHLEGLGLVRGAVEIHRRQRDWDSHGHGADPNYNDVVLHVALEVDGGDTRLQSGQQVPVISLASLLDSANTRAAATGPDQAGPAGNPSPDEGFSLWALLKEKGYSPPGTGQEMADLLDRAGDARFRQKSARYQAFLGEQGPEQTLYEGICEALGYRHNQEPFLKLAQRSPCRALVRAAGALPQEKRAAALEAWLQQLSGLAESPDIKLPRVGLGPPLARREWHCFRVRPANHPRRRVAGAAVLLARFLESGLVAGLQQAAESGIPGRLTPALVVGKSDAGGRSLIGPGRARDLAVNVVLPFFHALVTQALAAAPEDGCPDLESGQRYPQSYFQSYRRFGLLQDNELLREMRDRLLEPAWAVAINSARRQQGLLHLHHLLRGG